MTSAGGSIFPAIGWTNWAEQLRTLTPVERIGDLHFKREDRFAPLGYGGINGGKLRQCIFLIQRYVQENPGLGVVTAASVRSPQLSSTAAVAYSLGLRTRIVIGGKPDTCLRHSNVAVAAGLGAEFEFLKVAYNPALQRRARELVHGPLRGWYLLEYGIGVPEGATFRLTEEFHHLGAGQVANLPEDVETLIIPAGSCNTTISVLYGLAIYRPKRLQRVLLFGIGPNKLRFVQKRLSLLEDTSGVPILSLFDVNFHHNKGEEPLWPGMSGLSPYDLEFWDLHGTGYASYDDEHRRSYQGLDFHPRYEGKIWSFIEKNYDHFGQYINPRTCFWVVGSRPSLDAMPQVPRVDAVRLAEAV